MGESRSMLVCHGRPWDGRAISNDAATMAGRGGQGRHAPMAGRTRFARSGIVVRVWTWDADSIPDRGTRLVVHEERSRGWVNRDRCSCATVGHGIGPSNSNDAATMAGRGEQVADLTDGGSPPLRTVRNCGGRVDEGRGFNS